MILILRGCQVAAGAAFVAGAVVRLAVLPVAIAAHWWAFRRIPITPESAYR